MSTKLSPNMRAQLRRMVDQTERWQPANRGERATAKALRRRGLVSANQAGAHKLTTDGRHAALQEIGRLTVSRRNGRVAPVVTDLSVSRVKLVDKCALAYRYQHLDKIPAPSDRATKVFGNVIHYGLERWYGEPGSTNHQETSLASYVDQVWWELLPQDVANALRHALVAQREQDEVAEMLKLTRGVKGPYQTKDFLASPQHKRYEDARDQLLAAAAKCEEMTWPQDENALQAYSKSLVIAKQLQDRWQMRPRPMVVEKQFSIEFAGIRVRGRIDQIRADPDPVGQTLVELLDVKTGRQLMTQMEAFIQAFLYHEACLQEADLPDPDLVTFWLARHNRPQHGHIDRERHAKLAERILLSVKERIESGDYAPHYGLWCKSCDFKVLCEAEIGLWEPGTDTLVLGTAA